MSEPIPDTITSKTLRGRIFFSIKQALRPPSPIEMEGAA